VEQTFVPAQQMGGVRRKPVRKGEEIQSTNPALPPNKRALNCSCWKLIGECFPQGKVPFRRVTGNRSLAQELSLRSKFFSVKSKRSQIFFRLSLSGQTTVSCPVSLWIISSEFPAVPWVYSGGNGSRIELRRLISLRFPEENGSVTWGSPSVTSWLRQKASEGT